MQKKKQTTQTKNNKQQKKNPVIKPKTIRFVSLAVQRVSSYCVLCRAPTVWSDARTGSVILFSFTFSPLITFSPCLSFITRITDTVTPCSGQPLLLPPASRWRWLTSKAQADTPVTNHLHPWPPRHPLWMFILITAEPAPWHFSWSLRHYACSCSVCVPCVNIVIVGYGA